MSWNSKEPRWQGANKPRIASTQFVINSSEFDRIPDGQGTMNSIFHNAMTAASLVGICICLDVT